MYTTGVGQTFYCTVDGDPYAKYFLLPPSRVHPQYIHSRSVLISRSSLPSLLPWHRLAPPPTSLQYVSHNTSRKSGQIRPIPCSHTLLTCVARMPLAPGSHVTEISHISLISNRYLAHISHIPPICRSYPTDISLISLTFRAHISRSHFAAFALISLTFRRYLADIPSRVISARIGAE